MKNPYRKNTKHNKQKTIKIIQYFCEDLTATQTSKLLWVRRSTVNDWYDYIRTAIYRYCEKEKQEILHWEIEVDESYFWAKRVRWKRWRWAWWKIKVFGLLKRNGKVYTEIIDDVSAKTLQKIIRGKTSIESVINSDYWRGYDGLVDLWYEKHYRVHHWENEFARGKKHINGIESFRSYAKRRLSKFNGVKKEKFPLHLKECEFRFNCWLHK
jgi:transposase-like protein